MGCRPLPVSALTCNVVHLPPLPGTLVQECTRQCMYDERWSCGTPVHQCTPLTINLSIAQMNASGGNSRLATWDGELLQDNKSIPDNCRYFTLVFVKQIGHLPPGISSSLSDTCAQGPSGLGQLPPQDAHLMHTLVMTALGREDTNMTVDMCGAHVVVHLVYANDDTLLGILYQHANTLVGHV